VVVVVPGEHGEEFREGGGICLMAPSLSEEADGFAGSVEFLFEDGSGEDGVEAGAAAGMFVEVAGFPVAADAGEEVGGGQWEAGGEP
jgi:hypothetical protein